MDDFSSRTLSEKGTGAVAGRGVHRVTEGDLSVLKMRERVL